MKKILLILLASIFCSVSRAQIAGNPVQVIVNVVPPYSFNITDYQNHPERIIIKLINTGRMPYNVQLAGSFTGVSNGISIKTKQGYQSPQPIQLAGLSTMNVDAGTISNLFDINSLIFSGIDRNKVMQTGTIPEGDYQVCIQAYQYGTSTPISAIPPIGCSNLFTLRAIEPPVILNPVSTTTVEVNNTLQPVTIHWTIPPQSPPATQYTFRMVQVPDKVNPQVAMQSRSAYPVFEKTVNANVLVYGAGDPQLESGKTYALMVRAADPTGNSTFRNNGQSEVAWFKYAVNLPAAPTIDTTKKAQAKSLTSSQNNCSQSANTCLAKAPSGSMITSLQVNDVVTAYNSKFSITITSITTNQDGSFSGKGTVPVPFFNQGNLKVTFDSITVNTSKQLTSGIVKGDNNNQSISFIPTDIDQALSNATDSAQQNTALNIPFKFSAGSFGFLVSDFTLAPAFASFSVATRVKVPEGGPNSMFGLVAKNVCMKDNGSVCGDMKICLLSDFAVDATHLTLNATDAQGNPVTYIQLSNNKSGSFSVDQFTVTASYQFPDKSLVDASTKKALAATFSFDAKNGWGDWTATFSLPQFYISGLTDFKFTVANAVYDHSDKSNPAGFPSSYTNDNTWHGFYLQKISMDFPKIVSGTLSNPQAFGNGLIYDDKGLTGTVGLANLIDFGNGSLAGWSASLDTIAVQFDKSTFTSGRMAGKLGLPLCSNPQGNQLKYNCIISYNPQNQLQYSCNVTAAPQLNFDKLLITVNLDNSSNIAITYNPNDPTTPVKAVATLSGNLSLNTSIVNLKLPSFAIPSVPFQNLKLMTYSPYFDFGGNGPGGFNMGNTGTDGNSTQNTSGYINENTPVFACNTASGPNPDKSGMMNGSVPQSSGNSGDNDISIGSFSIAGFSGQLSTSLPSVNSQGINWPFSGKISFVEAGDNASGAQATAGVTIQFPVSLNNNGKITMGDPSVKIESIDFKGGANFGPVTVKGSVFYYNLDAPYGEGFAGDLNVSVANVLTVDLRGKFGHTHTPGNNDETFNYFDFSGLVNLSQSEAIEIYGPVFLFGFGGGFAYNEGITLGQQSQSNSAIALNKNDITPEMLQSPTGVDFTPSKGSFSFTGTALIALKARDVLDMDGTIGATITNGSLNSVDFACNARLLTTNQTYGPQTNPSCIGLGNTKVVLNTSDNPSFYMTSSVQFGVPKYDNTSLINADGNIEFYASPSAFWIYVGRPKPQTPNSIDILNIFKGTAYFETGTKIDDMPLIPNPLGGVDVSCLNTVNNTNRGNAKCNNVKSQDIVGGIVFGSDVSFDYSGQFLIFYAKLQAEMGFDFTLGKLSAECASGNGLAGWYAKGQAYFGASIDVGIKVHLFFIHGQFSILKAGVAAVIQAQAPNPTWVRGDLFAQYSILDGLVSGHMHYRFEHGDKLQCAQNDPADAVGGVKIISDISPEDGTDSVTLETLPSVTFNIAHKPYSFTEIKDDGTPVIHHLLFDASCVKYYLNGQPVNFSQAGDQYIYSYDSYTLLAKKTHYTIKVDAKMLDADTKKYVKAENSNDDYVESKTANFITNDGYDSIPPEMMATSCPLHSDVAVMLPQQQFIQLKEYINLKNTIASYKEGTQLLAVLYKNGVVTQTAQARTLIDKIVWTPQFALEKGNNYRIEVITRNPMKFAKANLTSVNLMSKTAHPEAQKINTSTPVSAGQAQSLANGNANNVYQKANVSAPVSAGQAQSLANGNANAIYQKPNALTPVSADQATNKSLAVDFNANANNTSYIVDSTTKASAAQNDMGVSENAQHATGSAGALAFDVVLTAIDFNTSKYGSYEDKRSNFEIKQLQLANGEKPRYEDMFNPSFFTIDKSKTKEENKKMMDKYLYHKEINRYALPITYTNLVCYGDEQMSRADFQGYWSHQIFQTAPGTKECYVPALAKEDSVYVPYSNDVLWDKLVKFIADNTGIDPNLIQRFDNNPTLRQTEKEYWYYTYSMQTSPIGKPVDYKEMSQAQYQYMLPESSNKVIPAKTYYIANIKRTMTFPPLVGAPPSVNTNITTTGMYINISLTNLMQDITHPIDVSSLNSSSTWESIGTAADGYCNNKMTLTQFGNQVKAAAGTNAVNQ